MKSQGGLFTVLALAVVCAGCAKDTSTSGSGSNGWSAFPVTIYAGATLANSPTALQDFQDGIAFWEAKAGMKLFDYQGAAPAQNGVFTGTPAAPGTILTNTIEFQNPWPFAQDLAGLTTANYSGTEIVGAVVMINSAVPMCSGDCVGSGDTSERKAITHELGHFLGMVHVQDTADIMYPVVQLGGSLDGVTIDAAALQALTAGR